jgi:pimeloyl-ACP methyl ester carboxylesterase
VEALDGRALIRTISIPHLRIRLRVRILAGWIARGGRRSRSGRPALTSRRPKPQHVAPRAVRAACRTLSAVAPPLAARLAADLFCRTRPRRVRPAEREVLDRARRLELPSVRRRLVAHAWGRGPIVLLHHGWSGNAAQMTAFVDPLVTAGFTAVALDARGHGSSGGRSSSFVAMVADALAWVDHLGEVRAMIGHSMGAMVTARVLARREVDRAVLLCPPAELAVYSELFARAMGFGERAHTGMVRYFERNHDVRWPEISAEHLPPDRPVPALVVYDRDDHDAPPEHAERWVRAWNGPVDTLRTEGLGHRQVLRDRDVLRACADWLVERPAAAEGADRDDGTASGA